MSTTSASRDWDPKKYLSRHADTTANIHHTMAWIYGVLGIGIVTLLAFTGKQDNWGVVGIVALVFGAIVALHASLAIGARNRNGLAKVGSVIIGVLMLAGFPIGTVVGGFLIYNGTQNWPPRHDLSTPDDADGFDLRNR